MKVGVMQPYFFPYIGYWQLINAVDTYVVFDDVNYITRGWINRNKILINGKPQYFNLPMLGASQNKLINEVKVGLNSRTIKRNLQVIKENYRKAPYFTNVYPMIEEIHNTNKITVSEFLMDSIKIICNYLGIATNLVYSSEIEKDNSLKGQSKIIQICESLCADVYINAIGGQALYDKKVFEKENIKLCFLKTGKIEYLQFNNSFFENLSIIDVMMFNSIQEIKKMLIMYTLI